MHTLYCILTGILHGSTKKCAHISAGAQVTDVCVGNSTGHQTGFIVRSTGHQTGFIVRSTGHQTGFIVRSTGHQTGFIVRSTGHQTGFIVRIKSPPRIQVSCILPRCAAADIVTYLPKIPY